MADTAPENQRACPTCKSCDVVPLIGALPGFQSYDTVDLQRIPTAECEEREQAEEPTGWRCENCGHEWPEEESTPAAANP
jgi:hypothetical protein